MGSDSSKPINEQPPLWVVRGVINIIFRSEDPCFDRSLKRKLSATCKYARESFFYIYITTNRLKDCVFLNISQSKWGYLTPVDPLIGSFLYRHIVGATGHIRLLKFRSESELFDGIKNHVLDPALCSYLILSDLTRDRTHLTQKYMDPLLKHKIIIIPRVLKYFRDEASVRGGNRETQLSVPIPTLSPLPESVLFGDKIFPNLTMLVLQGIYIPKSFINKLVVSYKRQLYFLRIDRCIIKKDRYFGTDMQQLQELRVLDLRLYYYKDIELGRLLGPSKLKKLYINIWIHSLMTIHLMRSSKIKVL
jgi:hypothetical protein